MEAATSALPPGAVGITASAGAKPRMPATNVRGDRKEGPAAPFAYPLDRAGAGSTSDLNHQFGFADPATVASMGSMGVAVGAGWNEVLGRIVAAVPVEMVDNQRAATRAAARHPGDGRSAPVARVRAWADLLVEHNPRHREDATPGRQRMAGDFTHTPLYAGLLGRATHRLVVAGVTTEPVGGLSGPVEGSAASLASVSHPSSLHQKGQS